MVNDRLAYEVEIKELTARQEAVWQEALPKFLAMRGCSLGLCVHVETLDLIARTHEDPEKREAARRRLDKERGERELAWNRFAREIEQMEIAKAVLGERRVGRL